MTTPRLDSLYITGDVSVEPATTLKSTTIFVYLIMGPTGSGKSAFIEALADKSQKLSISKDQLAGYTQTITVYRLVNVLQTTMYQDREVYLIDTPGFSDTKISEVEIMAMVTTWLKSNGLTLVQRILYLTPITQTRLSGSKRQTIEMLQAFLSPHSDLGTLVLVTTMWDTLHNERTCNRAWSNFEQLRNELIPELFQGQKVHLTRFMNTKNSALQIMDAGTMSAVAFSKPAYSISQYLSGDLRGRITSALQRKQFLEFDLAQPDAQANLELRSILEANQRENNDTLSKFMSLWETLSPCKSVGLEGAQEHAQTSTQATQITGPLIPSIQTSYTITAQTPGSAHSPTQQHITALGRHLAPPRHRLHNVTPAVTSSHLDETNMAHNPAATETAKRQHSENTQMSDGHLNSSLGLLSGGFKSHRRITGLKEWFRKPSQ